MKYYSILALLLLTFGVRAQQTFQIDWINDDLAPYSSFVIDKFQVNNKRVDPNSSVRQQKLIEGFYQVMAKIGLFQSDSSELSVIYEIQVDTLPIGFQRPNGVLPEDILTDITIRLDDNKVGEHLFVGNVNGVLPEDKKLEKTIKKIYKRFFRRLMISTQ